MQRKRGRPFKKTNTALGANTPEAGVFVVPEEENRQPDEVKVEEQVAPVQPRKDWIPEKSQTEPRTLSEAGQKPPVKSGFGVTIKPTLNEFKGKIPPMSRQELKRQGYIK